jgi:hypothetical protein
LADDCAQSHADRRSHDRVKTGELELSEQQDDDRPHYDGDGGDHPEIGHFDRKYIASNEVQQVDVNEPREERGQ